MASCDDDFSLLGDDNTTAATTATHPPNPNPNLIHHQRQSFAHRNIATPNPNPNDNDDDDNGNDVVSPDADGYSDSAFCSSQPNSKSNNTPPFHVVNVNPYDTDQNPFDSDPDLNKSRLNSNNIHTQHDKRTDREEVSDSGTPYPYKRPRGGSSGCGSSGGEYRKDREEWSDSAIACLLEAYTEKFMMLNRGNLRGRDWEEVAAMVSERCDKQIKNVEQCKNKVDNLKKRYKLERHRLTNGGVSASHWPWFKQMEQIVGNSVSTKAAAAPDDEKSGGAVANSVKQSKRYGSSGTSHGGQINNLKLKATTSARWRRVVFKISGSALAGTAPQNIDPKVAMLIAREVSIACRMGVEVAVVVGGRNFFCGQTWVTTSGLDRCSAYQIGMMATMMNSILLQSALEKNGLQTRVQSAFSIPEVAEPYSRQRAIRHLEKGRVVIFGAIGAGIGNPLFSTDAAAAVRASEIHADAVLKGTNVDGVFVFDSRSNNGIVAEQISSGELSSTGTLPMDAMAVRFCEDNGISVVIFNIHEPGNISRALCGEQVGTLIDQTGRVS